MTVVPRLLDAVRAIPEDRRRDRLLVLLVGSTLTPVEAVLRMRGREVRALADAEGFAYREDVLALLPGEDDAYAFLSRKGSTYRPRNTPRPISRIHAYRVCREALGPAWSPHHGNGVTHALRSLHDPCYIHPR